MLKDGFHTTQSLNDVRTVSVQIPEFTVVTLARPPERVALHVLVDLELGPSSEALVETKGTTILLEQSVDAGQAAIPAVLKILQR